MNKEEGVFLHAGNAPSLVLWGKSKKKGSSRLGLGLLEEDVEGSALVVGFEGDAASGALDDAFGDSQTESVAVALGGEGRTENARLNILRDARAVVGEGDLNLAVRIERIEHDDDIRVGSSFERLDGIAQDIDKDLTDLFAVGIDHDAAVRTDIADRYILVVEALERDDVG